MSATLLAHPPLMPRCALATALALALVLWTMPARTAVAPVARAGDLPRAWDPYLGTTRVQRASAFQAALHRLGARSVLVAFPGERHAMSAHMIASADGFLRALDLEHAQPEPVVGSPTPLRPPHSRARF